MKRDIRLYIEDFREEDFTNNTQIQDSVFRRLEIIGEAVKKIPNKLRNSYQEIPWKRIAGLRDVLIHEYFGVNVRRAWKLVKYDLPVLKQKIQKVRDDIQDSNSLFER